MKEEDFKYLAKSHLKSLLLWFCGSLAMLILSLEVTVWADSQSGWQGGFVRGLFLIIGTIGLFGVFCFGCFLHDWWKKYHEASRAAENCDEGELKKRYREVVGPIHWR